MTNDAPLRRLLTAIASVDDAEVLAMLTAAPALVQARVEEGARRAAAMDSYLSDIGHYAYAGDTLLHVAAAAHRPEIVRELIRRGASVEARNRRGAAPLHYAADGNPTSPRWKPVAQAATIVGLIAAGADPNAVDKNGVTALHRAVRTRCAQAVGTLLQCGADALQRNGNGSTPMMLATRQTGRGGSGSHEAITQQAEIIRLREPYSAER